MTQSVFQQLNDAELEHVSGGLSLTLGTITFDGPLGELALPTPLGVFGDIVGGLFKFGGALVALPGDFFGGVLTAIGGLFNFG